MATHMPEVNPVRGKTPQASAAPLARASNGVKIYRLADLAVKLDRDKTTLIRWEAEGKIPLARRDSRGWRYYTEGDFNTIAGLAASTLFEQRSGFASAGSMVAEGSRRDPPLRSSDERKEILGPTARQSSARKRWRILVILSGIAFLLFVFVP